MNLKDKTVVIDNKTYRYSKIVILSTKNEPCACILLNNNKKLIPYFKNQFRDELTEKDEIFQHLYFLSTDKICEGDWFIKDNLVVHCNEVTENELGCIPDNEVFCNTQTYFDRRNCYKVISSTDPSLNLPKPSDSFLQVYIDAYNKNEKIEECLVEYEYRDCENKLVHPLRVQDGCGIALKTTKGEITIRKVKESWSREEVEALILKFAEDCDTNEDLICYDGYINGIRQYNDAKNWISENL